MNIKPIRTEEDYRAALNRVEDLWGAELGTSEGDELDVLLPLIEFYEKRHHPIPPPDPIEAILFRMDQMAYTRKDLVAIIGTRGRVSEVLNRRRRLSLRMIRRLHQAWDIPAHILLIDYPVRQRKGKGHRSKHTAAPLKAATS